MFRIKNMKKTKGLLLLVVLLIGVLIFGILTAQKPEIEEKKPIEKNQSFEKNQTSVLIEKQTENEEIEQENKTKEIVKYQSEIKDFDEINECSGLSIISNIRYPGLSKNMKIFITLESEKRTYTLVDFNLAGPRPDFYFSHDLYTMAKRNKAESTRYVVDLKDMTISQIKNDRNMPFTYDSITKTDKYVPEVYYYIVLLEQEKLLKELKEMKGTNFNQTREEFKEKFKELEDYFGSEKIDEYYKCLNEENISDQCKNSSVFNYFEKLKTIEDVEQALPIKKVLVSSMFFEIQNKTEECEDYVFIFYENPFEEKIKKKSPDFCLYKYEKKNCTIIAKSYERKGQGFRYVYNVEKINEVRK